MSKYISSLAIVLLFCCLIYIEKDLFKMEFYTEQNNMSGLQSKNSQEVRSVHLQVKTQPIRMKIHVKTDLNDKFLKPMYFLYKIVKKYE
ncbi:hypothetical protein JOC86_000685 [Bacillus pakistanensis]|uniref:Uncharacterized protein n=1 Tax=Rossellomorea pakistanensis TaxID=992288 RepID=A0ABS2N8F9_9BACI|nr:hypothetical protein [Bacillus pakistanensis]MBM7584148.1 hypothetical protein [Bacillus pakistanensis]